MRKFTGLLCAAVIVTSLCSCAPRQARVLRAGHGLAEVHWSEDELAQATATRPMRTSAETSHSVLRLAGAEVPHTHDRHDLTCVLLRGRARLHLGADVYDVVPGDVMDIPRGTVHWAEAIDEDACEVYVIFSPAFDGNDFHEVK
ncbi:MAG: cupin domain-containing protein [Planctomycetota bacterium]